MIIVPPWISHVFEGRHKKKNKSFHSTFALRLLGVFILLPGSAHFPPPSQQTAFWTLPFHHTLQNAKCLPAVIYNLRSNPPTNNRQNIMLPLAPPNTHPCREGNTPSLPEVPPKLHLCCLFWSLGSSLAKPLHEIMKSLEKCTCWRGYQQLSQGTQRPAR